MGSGGKTPEDNSMAMYQAQQAQLAREKEEAAAKEKAQQEAEQARRDKLRQQMLGEAVSTDDEENSGALGESAVIQKNTLV